MAPRRSLIPPQSLGAVLRPICDAPDTDFTALLSAVSGPRSFSLVQEQLDALQAQAPSLAQNLTFTLAALSYVYSHVARLVESGVPYTDAIAATVDDLTDDAEWGDQKDRVRDRFASLFKSETHQRFRKIRRLQTGFIPNATGFSTFVDLRPDFGEGEALEIKGYLPVVQFRVNTDSNNPSETRFVFQVTEDSLKELRKTLERAESKIALLKDQSTIALQIFRM